MSATYGYARVSTTEQDLSIQEAALKAAGCTIVRSEKRTGTKREGRAELSILFDFLRPGDTLMVTRIDRLASALTRSEDSQGSPNLRVWSHGSDRIGAPTS